MVTYTNPWHIPGNFYSPKEFTRDIKPIIHAGCEIYKVNKDQYDVVKSGVCIAQRAGLNGAKKCAEAVEDLPNPTYHDVWGRMMEKHGHG